MIDLYIAATYNFGDGLSSSDNAEVEVVVKSEALIARIEHQHTSGFVNSSEQLVCYKWIICVVIFSCISLWLTTMHTTNMSVVFWLPRALALWTWFIYLARWCICVSSEAVTLCVLLKFLLNNTTIVWPVTPYLQTLSGVNSFDPNQDPTPLIYSWHCDDIEGLPCVIHDPDEEGRLVRAEEIFSRLQEIPEVLSIPAWLFPIDGTWVSGASWYGCYKLSMWFGMLGSSKLGIRKILCQITRKQAFVN